MVWPFLFVAFLVGCGTDETLPETGNPSVPDNSGASSSEVELVSETNPIPNGYEQEAEQRGSIVRMDYDTRDYAEGSGASRTNTAYVYLPYGYDEQKRYNIMYLVHGHYGTASTYFETEDGMLRNLLDQMIAHGDIAPMIVVTPTYNYGQPTANYTDADPYCRALPQELVNDLILWWKADTIHTPRPRMRRASRHPVHTVPSAASRWVQSPLGMPLTRHSMHSNGLCPSAATAGR